MEGPPIENDLFEFASNGDIEGVKRCIGSGISTKTRRFGRTALHLAALHGNPEVIEALMKNNSDVNALDKLGQTPLILAARYDRPKSINMLLQFKADLDIKDTVFEQSAVSYAAERVHKEVVKLLIDAGCNIYSNSTESFPPLERAARHGYREILRCFLVEESNGALLPRARAIAETLRHACENEYSKTKDFIIAEDGYLQAKDKNDRTVFSWAAEGGNGDTVRLLLDNGAEIDSRDHTNRTPLSYAATSGSADTVNVLLDGGAEIDSRDHDNRTPLSFAAESGSLAVVRELLSRNPVTRPVKAKEQLLVDSKANNTGWTPLWYAAKGGHVKVAEALLEIGADPLVVEKRGEEEGDNLLQYLEKQEKSPGSNGESIDVTRLEHLRKVLEPFFSLLPHALSESEELDKSFSAIILQFPKNPDGDLRPEPSSVRDLLTSEGERRESSARTDLCLKWLHLPSNNMRWVEILMKRHDEVSGNGVTQNFYRILSPKLWADNQNIPPDNMRWHERFMRAGCHVLPLLNTTDSEILPESINQKQSTARLSDTQTLADEAARPSNDKENDDKIRRRRARTSENPELCQKGFVLFMPYLHWERKDRVDKLKKIWMKDKPQNAGQDESRRSSAQRLSQEGSNNTEKLHWMYLGEKHPLHIRRTLDQYYYSDSSNLEKRDDDQTTLRWFEDQNLDPEEIPPVLTMVDQLWMWILPKCGPSPPTIITAFPQGSSMNDPARRTALVNNIIGKCGDFGSRSSYEVAEVIVAECSRIYFDSMSNRERTTQFLDVFRTSIGTIMDNDIVRFRQFQMTIENLAKLMDKEKNKNIEDEKQPQKEETPTNNPNQPGQPEGPLDEKKVLRNLLNIEKDIEDLRRIKDIRDELHMMDSVFRKQDGVIQAMDQITQRRNGRNGIKDTSYGVSIHTSSDHLQAVIKRNLEEVEALDRFARKAGAAIEQLLELKQKQADLLLTNAIYNINDATDKQGKTILAFTLVTILFLPLSFMASFLALDVSQFPRHGDKLSLNWVVTIILSVSLPLAVLFSFVAFSLNKSQRETAHKTILKWKLEAKNSAKNVLKDKLRLPTPWNRNQNRDINVEKDDTLPQHNKR
ncbi:ankyrin repeat-containing domain protein [Xylaria arbuscula]|nr:ankyrin repeat-containing domain protein [Xylaria arbuscula]